MYRNSVAILEEPDASNLIAEINVRVNEYNNVFAREKGWRNSQKSEEEEIEYDCRF